MPAGVPQAGNVPAEQEEEKPEFYTDPEEPEWDSLDPNHPLNRDMVVEAPRRKKKGKGKKKSSRSRNDLNNADQDMQPEAGWNFNAQKLPARKKAGWFRRFLTATSYYAGKSIGKAFNFLGNLIYVPFTWNWSKWWRSRAGNKDSDEVIQDKRDHDTIPGWNGAKYEKGGGNNEVIADFRRVPTVWSYLTAAQAEDDKGKPLPPKVGVYVQQPKEGADKDVDWAEFGHSGIGIEYSRYSRQTKRYERYELRYGFYQSGATWSGGILTNSSNVIVPGTLKDEHDSAYTVNRKFKASARQVNDILKASETWADKGYNASTRNCTTFVKEMVRDVAHLPLGNDIFTEDHIRLSSLGNFGYFASTASTTNAKMGMQSQFEKLGQQDDLSYAHFGNKRFTKQEYRQYKDSLEKGVNRVTTADTPNSAAENLRRLKGPFAGEIGSYDFSGVIPKNADGNLVRNFPNIRGAIDDASQKVVTQIQAVTGKTHAQLLAMGEDFPEFFKIYDRLSGNALSLALYDVSHNDTDPELLRDARKEVDGYIESLNKLLYEYFKNDKRLHLPVMHLISVLNYGNSLIDFAYNSADRGDAEGGDLGNIRGEMEKNEYSIGAGGFETAMTPSHYESYLQIFKTPQEAVRQYARFKELKEIDNDPNHDLNKNQKKEFEKLERIEKLADQFDKSHRYMLEKSSYSQQDVDYAFSLKNKQEAGDANGTILSHSSCGIYRSLIFEKIFGGMKQRYLNHITVEQSQDVDAIRTWLEDDLITCVGRKKDDFISVIRAIARTAENKELDFLIWQFAGEMRGSWFQHVFKKGPENGPLADGSDFIESAFTQGILAQDQSRFKKTLTGLFRFILAEDEVAKPDSNQKLKKKSNKK